MLKNRFYLKILHYNVIINYNRNILKQNFNMSRKKDKDALKYNKK